jgi:uncharacterized protein YjlB
MDVQFFRFDDDGDIPNNPRWPMIVYAKVFDPKAVKDMAVAFEERFAANGWGNGWRNGIFNFPHYHSNQHEALGIARGTARVRFGGSSGGEFTVSAGDAVLLPAGTGHQRLSSSPDLLVIGCYPPGPHNDLMRDGEADKTAIRKRIAAVPKPASDPIGGKDGPTKSAWTA